jgi:ribosomal protein L16 Arg81 hydroxylase
MDPHGHSPAWLTEFLAPVSVRDFVANYWLKRHLFCRGSKDKFSHLLSWPVLNTILEHHWRETFRFRLAQQGRDLSPESYADLNGYTPRIRAKDLTDRLRQGATLSFDAIDELHEPLTRLAESFESFFRGGTKINIYAGWRARHGLDLHRDNQEIFILQLDGRKRWVLYGLDIDGVDRSRLSETSVPPPGAEFDEVVEAGDLLYIPRGCYHVAVPMNEPTLHLTLGVKNPRGMDLLRWMAERLKASDIATRDLPILSTEAERIAYATRLRGALLDDLDADLVEQYLNETGSNFKPRPSFNLPWSATPELLLGDRDVSIRMLVRAHARSRTDEDGPFELRYGSRRFRFPRSMQPIVERLEGGVPRTISSLIDEMRGRLDDDAVRLLVGLLVKEGLVEIRQ